MGIALLKNAQTRVTMEIVQETPKSSQSTVPVLADDILRMIFEELSTKDRHPLALVSRRFCDIDYDVGKRVFDKISVILGNDFDSINIAMASGSYFFKAPINKEYNQMSPYIEHFFKNATANAVRLIVTDNHDARAARALSSVFESMTYQCLEIYFKGNEDDLSDFFTGQVSLQRCLKDVYLNWQCKKHQNLPRLRQALQRLPKMKNLYLLYAIEVGRETLLSETKVKYDLKYKSANCLLDGKTMLHLVENSDDVHLDCVDCAAKEVIDAFEVVCESKVDTKFVFACIANTIVDEVFTIAGEMGGFEVEYQHNMAGYDGPRRCVKDITRRSKMFGWYGPWTKSTVIIMFKIDNDGNAMNKKVNEWMNE